MLGPLLLLAAGAPASLPGAILVGVHASQASDADEVSVAPLEPLDLAGVQPLHRVGRLLLGGQPSVDAFMALADRGVDLVIDLRRPEEERGFAQAVLLEELGVEYEVLGFGGPVPLSDDILDAARARLAAHARSGEGEALLHCASSNRVGAVWLTARVLDEGVSWEAALADARRAGLRSPALEEAALHYVLGAGKQELGAEKLRLREEFPDVARISVRELEERLARPEAPPLLLDVRAPAEYDVSHLADARRARTLEEARALLAGAPRDREIVVYCSVGRRSADLARELGEAGYSNVRNLEGSIFEWANTGRPVYRDGEPVRAVHPFDARWGRLLDKELRAEVAAD